MLMLQFNLIFIPNFLSMLGTSYITLTIMWAFTPHKISSPLSTYRRNSMFFFYFYHIWVRLFGSTFRRLVSENVSCLWYCIHENNSNFLCISRWMEEKPLIHYRLCRIQYMVIMETCDTTKIRLLSYRKRLA